MTDLTNTTDHIELSIIIPTYNRAERLRACLESLCRQTQPSTDFEVIVVVDGSTDGTHEMLASFSASYRLRVILQKNSGQNVARNFGVASARGRYCLFLDDDIIAGPRLVAEHFRVQRAQPHVVGIGRITLMLSPNCDWFMRCHAKGWDNHYVELNRVVRPSWLDCYGGNMSLLRAAFLEAGGFAHDLPRGHDVELAYRLERQGLSFIYIPDAIGHQDERKRFREFAADAEKAGTAWVKLYQRHPPVLPDLLGTFGDVAGLEMLLRRILLAFRISPCLLALAGPLLARYGLARRWYRFLHGYCYWRGVRRAVSDRETWQRLTHGTPILLYHAFGKKSERPSRYVIPQRRFALQMAWLKRMGYHVLSLEDFLNYRREHRLPPSRSVVITMDDGYRDVLMLAHPILRRYGFSATIFLVSGCIGGSNQWARSELSGRPLLSLSDIENLRRQGIKFGAHTRSHRALVGMSRESIGHEVAGSRIDLERRLGVPIPVFAYPYGEYDSIVQSVVEEAGFLGSCTAESGMNMLKTPLHALRRSEICGSRSLLSFALTVWRGIHG